MAQIASLLLITSFFVIYVALPLFFREKISLNRKKKYRKSLSYRLNIKK